MMDKLQEWQKVLFGAADLISFNGFVKGTLYDEKTGAHCPLGAIETMASSTNLESIRLAVKKFRTTISGTPTNPDAMLLMVSVWSDWSSRSKEEVVLKLRQAASQD